jgi:putative addiction module component (TIGR02574 family)
MAETVDVTKLTTKERLDLIGELWDSIAPKDGRLTPSQEAELGRRMTTFDIDAKDAVPWEDIETEFNKRS